MNYGVRWQEVNRKGQVVVRERLFDSRWARLRWGNSKAHQANFVAWVAYWDNEPTTQEDGDGNAQA